MKWLKNKIINWLFEKDYTFYLDLLKNYVKTKEEMQDLRQENIKTIESEIKVRESYVEITKLCSQISNDNQKIIEANKELLAENERLIKIIKEFEENYNA